MNSRGFQEVSSSMTLLTSARSLEAVLMLETLEASMTAALWVVLIFNVTLTIYVRRDDSARAARQMDRRAVAAASVRRRRARRRPMREDYAARAGFPQVSWASSTQPGRSPRASLPPIRP